MEHKYCQHIQNKSLHGYVVCGVPIKTLYDAEELCMKEGVEPDKDHLVYDPETAKHDSAFSDRELGYIKILLEAEEEKAEAKLKALREESDRLRAEKSCILNDAKLGVLQRYIENQSGIWLGIRQALSVVSRRKYELWEISRIRRPNKG